MRNPLPRFARRSALVLLAAAIPGPATAQIPAFHDSVRAVSDVSVLMRMAAERDARTDYASLVERSLISIRMLELARSRSEGERARALVDALLEEHPDSAWVHYLDGLALAHAHDIEIPNMRGLVTAQAFAEAVGEDPLSHARRALERALSLDPRFVEPAVLLGDIALRTRMPEHMESAAALIAAVHAATGAPALAFQYTRLSAALGRLRTAAAAAQSYAAAAGGSPEADHLRATVLLRIEGSEEEGAGLYFSGLERASPALVETYFEELVAAAAEIEVLEWERLEEHERAEWIREFWELRAATSGVTVPDRLSEHYRRLAHAMLNYRRGIKRGSPEEGALLARARDIEKLQLEDRGVMYIRHGPPREIVRTIWYGVRPNETWIYRAAEGGTDMFHFVALRGGHDFVLVDDLFTALEAPTDEGVLRLLEERAPWEPRYALLATRWRTARRGNGTALDVQDVILGQRQVSAEIARETMDALDSDSHLIEFENELPFYYDVYRFDGSGELTDVTAALAVPGQRLQPRAVDGELVYSLELSLIVVDTATNQVTRVDTVQHFRSPRRLGRDEYIRTHVSLAVPPSPNTVHRLVLRNAYDEDQGQIYGGETPITDFSATRLQVSDLVLAEPEPGDWRRGSVALGLVPPREFGEGKSLRLFYELYHVPADMPYRTHIRIVPVDQSVLGRVGRLLGLGRDPIDISFEGVAQPDANGMQQETRTLSGDLRPGKYELRVTVTNLATGSEVVQTREFIVTEAEAE